MGSLEFRFHVLRGLHHLSTFPPRSSDKPDSPDCPHHGRVDMSGVHDCITVQMGLTPRQLGIENQKSRINQRFSSYYLRRITVVVPTHLKLKRRSTDSEWYWTHVRGDTDADRCSTVPLPAGEASCILLSKLHGTLVA
jgi:hypothetical protein